MKNLVERIRENAESVSVENQCDGCGLTTMIIDLNPHYADILKLCDAIDLLSEALVDYATEKHHGFVAREALSKSREILK